MCFPTGRLVVPHLHHALDDVLATVSECLLLHLALKGMPQMQGPSLPSRRARDAETGVLCLESLACSSILPGCQELLENQLADLTTLSCMDFYTAFEQFWFLSFLCCALLNVHWLCCLIYSLICNAWTLIHFFAKIGTAQPCAAYAQNECPIYTGFDWHKPQFTTVIAVLVCLVARPVACRFYAALATKCRHGCEKSEVEVVAIVP
eukprot:Skav226227  [mRNA]  locus=scaffold1218:242704:243321:- [translate_table: standard]